MAQALGDNEHPFGLGVYPRSIAARTATADLDQTRRYWRTAVLQDAESVREALKHRVEEHAKEREAHAARRVQFIPASETSSR